jgi:hypothetical protein
VQDSLTPTAELMSVVLGPAHLVAQALQDLAEANLSAASKQARLDQERRMQVRCETFGERIVNFTDFDIVCHEYKTVITTCHVPTFVTTVV